MTGDERIILALNSVPTKADFLHRMGVKPGSFAAQLLEGVYRQFLRVSRDLRNDFDRYYCVEYDSFDEYIQVAHDMELNEDDRNCRHVFLITSFPSIVDQSFDDNLLKSTIDALKELGAVT